MDGPLAPLHQFIANWRASLEREAKVVFECQTLEESFDAPSAVADQFVTQFNLKPIGFNWEMLDASADANGARAATQVMSDAFEREMLHRQEWLGKQRARACANEFVDAFKPARRTILSNRFDGLWNPLTNATFEWAFAGFDDQKIALLLVMAQD